MKDEKTYWLIGGLGLAGAGLYYLMSTNSDLQNKLKEISSSLQTATSGITFPYTSGASPITLNLGAGLTGLESALTSPITNATSGFKDALSTATATATAPFTNLAKGFNDATKDLKDSLNNAGKYLVSELPTSIGSGIGSAVVSIPANLIGGTVKGVATGSPFTGSLAEAISSPVAGLYGLTQLATGKSVSQISQDIQTAKASLSNLSGIETLGAVGKGIATIPTTVVSVLNNIASGISNNIAKLFGGK